MKYLLMKDEIVSELNQNFDKHDLFSIGRRLGIDCTDFYVDQSIHKDNVERFVTKIDQINKLEELYEIIKKNDRVTQVSISTSDRTAIKFGKLFNSILEGLSDIEEKDFKESDLFTPTDFEEKMRKKAKLGEDIINIGIKIKPDISVLRRKAYNLDYTKYNLMINKLSRFYRQNICKKYPIAEYNSSHRFNALYDELLNMVPEELFDIDDNIDEKVEGIIFDTISQCLIFNE